jgi:RNA polymerase sigma-70 factor (ECF subfamily)
MKGRARVPSLSNEVLRPALPPKPCSPVAELYRAHAQTVARWASRLGGPAIDVEDVVQEVFLVVQRRFDGFRGEAHIKTWLYRITANTVRWRRRKEKWRRWLGGSADEVAGGLAARGPTPLESLEVYRVLDGMRERYRTVLILFEIEGMTGAEIAALMGAKVDTVWVWLYRARKQFEERSE